MSIQEKKKTISIAARKAKGRKLQKWICEKISELTGFDFGVDCPIESRPMGQKGVDIRLENKVKKFFPFSIEAKNQEKWNMFEFIEQAKKNEEENTIWMLILSKNRLSPVIMVDADNFFKLLEQTDLIRFGELLKEVKNKKNHGQLKI